ncbi:hypothetical protein FBU30_010267 [Linnemannia zychae]|nr:hypothetical protein FBU30_010267 [Linnemannia zychae]
MKLFLKLSLAALLVSSTLGLTLQDFILDPKVQSLAPHLIQDIHSQGIESFSDTQDTITVSDIPIINDIVQFVSLNIFNAGDADWSQLEATRRAIIEQHGAESLSEASNFKDIDTRHAALVISTIYDTVISLPAPSKEKYSANLGQDTADNSKAEGIDKEKNDNGSSSSAVWEYFSFGLTKSSDAVKKAKGIVTPRAVCETTDTAYLKGVDDVVYYGSLTNGLAAGALVSAPLDSPVQSSDIKAIVHTVGRLAIELQMAQSVARLAERNPSDLPVRAMIYLALVSDTTSSSMAQNARDLQNLIENGLAKEIPESVLISLINQAALAMVNKSVNEDDSGSSVFGAIPIVRNILAFSSDVLSANNIGDILKYVFCPEPSQGTDTAQAEVVTENIKQGTENIAEKTSETVQKVLKIPQDAAENIAESVKEGAKAVKDASATVVENAEKKLKEVKDDALTTAAEDVENSKVVKDEASAKLGDTIAKVQDKVVEGTNKFNEAGEKLAENTAENVGAKAERIAEKVEEKTEKVAKKAEVVKEKIVDEAKSAADKIVNKVDEVREEL